MADTEIEWADKVWNPTRGCDIYSAECVNCYAMREAHRFSKPGMAYEGLTTSTRAGPVWVGKVVEVPSMLGAPLQWKKAQRVFVDSMSDLFYGDEADAKRAEARIRGGRGEPFRPVSVEFIQACFEIMAACPQHTFLILTKRPGRMASVLLDTGLPALRNVLVGCSAGTQYTASRSVAAMRSLADAGWRTWVSYEPALERVNWAGWEFIEWLVAGEESSWGRRSALLHWFSDAREWARKAGVAFFMKQMLTFGRRGAKLAFEHFPTEIRVREFPVDKEARS